MSQLHNKRDYKLKVVTHLYSPRDLVYQLDNAMVKRKCRKPSPSRAKDDTSLEDLKSAQSTSRSIETSRDEDVSPWVTKLQNLMREGDQTE